MNQGTQRGLVAALAVAVAVLAGCGGGDQTDAAATAAQYRMGPPLTDSTYALIIEADGGGDTLTTALFQTQYQRFIQQVPAVAMDPEQSKQLRRGIAEEFIRRYLIGEEARRLALQADSAVVAEQIDMIRGNFESQEQFDQFLAARGITMDSLRSAIGEETILQQMQEKMVEAAPKPTAEELDAFRQEQAQQVRAQHILFRVSDPGQKDEVIDKANAVLDSVKAGADFAILAARYGTDGTARQGGDLGFFSRADMVKPFSDAAFALSDSGDVASELVETSFGYHIIRLTGRRTAALMDTSRASQMMMRERQQEAFDQAYDALRGRVVIRVNPDVIQADLNESLGE